MSDDACEACVTPKRKLADDDLETTVDSIKRSSHAPLVSLTEASLSPVHSNVSVAGTVKWVRRHFYLSGICRIAYNIKDRCEIVHLIDWSISIWRMTESRCLGNWCTFRYFILIVYLTMQTMIVRRRKVN